jgi:hypothetical protein
VDYEGFVPHHFQGFTQVLEEMSCEAKRLRRSHTGGYEGFVSPHFPGATQPNSDQLKPSRQLYQGRLTFDETVVVHRVDTGALFSLRFRDVAPRGVACFLRAPLSSEYGTYKAVKARFWPWLNPALASRKSPETLSSSCLTRNRHGGSAGAPYMYIHIEI